MSLTDSRRLYVELREAGEAGLHSHEIRRRGYSGNPSQRCKDIASHGVGVFTARENVGKRPGSRYWLSEFAPDWAVPVRPNGVEGGGGTEGAPVAAPLNALDLLDEEVTKDAAERGPRRDTGGVLKRGPALDIEPAPEDCPHPVAIVRDYTDPNGGWRELPWDEEKHRPVSEAA